MKIYKALALLTVLVTAANIMEASATGGRPANTAQPAKKKAAAKKAASSTPSKKFQPQQIGGTGGL